MKQLIINLMLIGLATFIASTSGCSGIPYRTSLNGKWTGIIRSVTMEDIEGTKCLTRALYIVNGTPITFATRTDYIDKPVLADKDGRPLEAKPFADGQMVTITGVASSGAALVAPFSSRSGVWPLGEGGTSSDILTINVYSIELAK